MAEIKEGQKIIQIPICVGSEQKILTIIEIQAPNERGFSQGTPVSLICELTEDKLLKVETIVNSQSIKSTMINPFSNREITLEERELYETEKEVNNETAFYLQ
ncbi:hypothetical protein [Crocosphaera sp.]|uniref:hypothetical protein n=1 Tax=Crocosphaera sp. TaxID=2729996 RepID=UPI003F27DF5B|nr:hypothetical protein [Crocosphaera sp.]